MSLVIVKLLKSKKIEGIDKTRVITALLENIDALPIRDAVSIDKGQIFLRGKPITDIDQAQALKQGANAMIHNGTRRIAEEQILFEASKIGLHQGLTPEQIVFSKAAIWVIQQFNRIYHELDGL